MHQHLVRILPLAQRPTLMAPAARRSYGALRECFADGDGAAGDHPGVVDQVRCLDVLVEVGQGCGLGDRDQVAAPEPADLSFDASFSWAPLSPGWQKNDSKP